ncbi:hypothetical protein DPQ25_03375 [Hydrogeniiclostridium mannosilyticum]|uniref:Uncharacterized protein n=1 Tax=Hydrogeniiclostridium mannosilyticum TaxID=2764322 RepID=A0A328UHG7_9FIRM|nr:hypothetical protein DPQ25_03375 [Hydrogeniiclostridium mannosilyticum]
MNVELRRKTAPGASRVRAAFAVFFGGIGLRGPGPCFRAHFSFLDKSPAFVYDERWAFMLKIRRKRKEI